MTPNNIYFKNKKEQNKKANAVEHKKLSKYELSENSKEQTATIEFRDEKHFRVNESREKMFL